jgi:hypothetical protein
MLTYIRLLFCLSLLVSATSSALPRFALRGGEASCRGCHVDPTGGRLRTEGGDNFAMKRLAMWERGPKFSANIGEGIRIGVDARSQFMYFANHIVENYTTGKDSSFRSVNRDTTYKSSGGFEMALPIYLSAKLSDAIDAFVKINLLQGTSAGWEGFVTAHVVHSSGEFIDAGSVVSDAYVKIGAFYPAFGIRFDDHTVYTRGGNATISGFGNAGDFWQPNYKDEGVELGAELFDHAFITAALLNGNETNQSTPFKSDPNAPYAVALRGVVNSGPLMDHEFSLEAGGSMYLHSVQRLGKKQDSSAQTRLVAIHGGIHYGPASALFEWDMGNYIYHIVGGYADTTHSIATELAYDITKGLTGVVRFDNFYGGKLAQEATNIKTRFMVGLQWFPVRFLEIRPEYRIAKGTAPTFEDPTKQMDVTETTALIQTHIFF